MVERRPARTAGHAVEHGRHDLRRRVDRERHFRHHHARAIAGGHEVEGVAHGVVLVVGGQQLVVRLEAQGAEHRVDAGGRVGDEGQVIGLGAHEGANGRARRVERRLQPVRP